MIAEAMQGAGIVLAFGAVGWVAASRLMQSDTVLPGGYEDATRKRKAWEEKLRPAGEPKVRGQGVR